VQAEGPPAHEGLIWHSLAARAPEAEVRPAAYVPLPIICRSNAYTDFHHTVFHVHSPDRNGNTGQPMLWQGRRQGRQAGAQLLREMC